MEQTVIAEVGSAYRSEWLFHHCIDSFRAGREVSQTGFDAAWTTIFVALMKVGLRRSKTLMVRPEHDHGLLSGLAKLHRTSIGAPSSPTGCAGELLRTVVLGGCNVFWCLQCQT